MIALEICNQGKACSKIYLRSISLGTIEITNQLTENKSLSLKTVVTTIPKMYKHNTTEGYNKKN